MNLSLPGIPPPTGEAPLPSPAAVRAQREHILRAKAALSMAYMSADPRQLPAVDILLRMVLVQDRDVNAVIRDFIRAEQKRGVRIVGSVAGLAKNPGRIRRLWDRLVRRPAAAPQEAPPTA